MYMLEAAGACWGCADALCRSYSLGAEVCPVPVLEKKFKGQKTLGDADILTVHESGPIGFSEVTAHKKDRDNLGRVWSIAAITTATTNITCGGKTGQAVFAYCKEKEMGDDTENVFKYLKGYCKYSRRICLC